MNAISKKEEIQVKSYVYEYYNIFIETLSGTSKTYYKKDISFFFNWAFSKDVEFVTIDELVALKSADAINYQTYLASKYVNASVNRKISTIRSFIKFLSADISEINGKMFDNIKTKDSKLDSDGYDTLSWSETLAFIKYFEDGGEELQKFSLMCKCGAYTGLRVDVIRKLCWSQIKTKTEHGIEVKYIDTVQKRKRIKKALPDSLYFELKERFSNLKEDEEFFSDYYGVKVSRLIKSGVKHLGLDPSRKIVFHSFKSSGIMRVLDITDGDIKKAQEHGCHSSYQTTDTFYVKNKEKLSDQISYTIDKNIEDKYKLEDYDKESIIKAIKTLDNATQIRILKQLTTV